MASLHIYSCIHSACMGSIVNHRAAHDGNMSSDITHFLSNHLVETCSAALEMCQFQQTSCNISKSNTESGTQLHKDRKLGPGKKKKNKTSDCTNFLPVPKSSTTEKPKAMAAMIETEFEWHSRAKMRHKRRWVWNLAKSTPWKQSASPLIFHPNL